MCNTIGSVELLNPERLFVENFEIDSTKCNGSADGSVSIFVTGGIPGYTYQWNDPFGQTSSTATGLGVGVYNVLIKDSTDCEILESYQIFEPEPIEIGFNVISLDCFGTNTSEIEAMATQGRPPYSYEWSNGQNSATAQNLPTGINYVTVTDDNDCMQIDSFIIDLSEAFEVEGRWNFR